MKKLNNWAVVQVNPTPWTPPEMAAMCLHGEVTGHERCKDGLVVTTSEVVGQRSGLIVTRSGSEYRLGTVEPEYEKLFPGALQRVLSSVPEIK